MANLNASVADARSATYTMQNEFDSIIGFEEWYSINRKNENDPDFEFLTS